MNPISPEGTLVPVLAPEGDETFELATEEEATLLAAIAEAERGETTNAADLLKQIRREWPAPHLHHWQSRHTCIPYIQSPFPIIASLFPPLQQLNPLPKLLSRRLIDTTPGARD
jgi:hypothetical protein